MEVQQPTNQMRDFFLAEIQNRANQIEQEWLYDIVDKESIDIERVLSLSVEVVVEKIEKFLIEAGGEQNYFKLFRRLTNMQRTEIAGAIREAAIQQWPELEKHSFATPTSVQTSIAEDPHYLLGGSTIQIPADSSEETIDYATYLSEQLLTIELFEYETRFYGNSSDTAQKPKTLFTYWVEGWGVLLQLFLFSLIASVIYYPCHLIIESFPVLQRGIVALLLVLFIFIGLNPLVARLAGGIVGFVEKK